MKRTAVLLMLLCMLTVTASAAYVPEDVVSENRDGRQLIIKTYTLPPDADPSELIEEPFELEGYTYHHLETVKEEQAFKDSKAQTEVVTLETNTDDLAKILEQLAPTMEYNKDGYSGTLTLDHTTIQTEAAGYTTKYYTITDTKQFPGLSRNDPSCVPTTTVKNGSTGITVCALSQLSRPQKGGENEKAPGLHSLRQSGQIEQDADGVLLLYKEEPNNPRSRRCLKIAKNKDGEAGGIVYLVFDGAHQRFKPSVVDKPVRREPEYKQMTFTSLADSEPIPFEEGGDVP